MSRPPLRALLALGLFSALGLLFVIAAQLPAEPPLPAATPSGPADTGESFAVPGARIFDRIVYLPLRVKGAGPFPFVLDTGAGPNTALDTGLADSLGLAPAPLTEAGGAGEETVAIGSLPAVDLALGPLSFPDSPAITIPLRRLDPHWGKRKDGVVGGDILARFLTEIDYPRGQVILHPPAAAATLPGERIPAEMVNQFFFVRAELLLHGQDAPLPALLMVDTGLRVTTFCRPFAARHGLAAQSPQTLTGVTGYGIGGVSRGVVGRLRALRLGGLTIEEPVVNFSQDAKGALASEDFAGILGADILSRCRVGLDYAGAQLILEPGDAWTAPSEFDMAGLRFVAEGDAFEQLAVFFVFPDSPASAAGIEPGDRVLEIDGLPAATWSREALRLHMQREGALVRLELERAGAPFTATLRLRRLV